MSDPANISSATVAEAADYIATLDSADAVLAYVRGDERKGVHEAADVRLAELADSGEISTADPRALPGTPLATGGSGTKRVRTRYPIDRFEHGLDGVEVITADGVDVPADKLEELLDLAREHETQLEEVEA